MSLLSFSFSSPYAYIIVAASLLVAALFFIWRKKGVAVAGLTKITPTLSQYSKDLTQLARDGKLDPVIGREEEIERVIQTLCRRTKNNPVLIGKPGVGKTAIAESLAQLIAKKKVPKILLGKKVLSLDITSIVAGTKYRGEFEKRLKQIADEITASQRRIILFIDEVHTLGEAGGAEGSIGAGDILKPALARGDLQVIGATTVAEYKKFIKKDVTLDRRLHPILVDEPTPKETVMILKGIKRRYEQFHKVKITDKAIVEAVNLAAKHIKDKSFPDRAIDLMDEAASKVSIEHLNEKPESQWPKVQPTDVQEVMKEWLENRVI